MAHQKPREIAARVLERWQSGRQSLDSLLSIRLQALGQADRALGYELVLGAVRWRATLDWLIAQKTGGRAQNPLVLNILRLGLFQMFWLDRIPSYAAINESVALAKSLGAGSKAGFVNAVLRAYDRDREMTRTQLADLKQQNPALGYSHPGWLCERWEACWGRKALLELLDWNNRVPPTYARVNRLKTEPRHLIQQWDREGIQYRPAAFDWVEADSVFELVSTPPVSDLKSFQDGGFYIQDPSTLLAVTVLDPQPGQAVLDRCAAPGGKAIYIAERLKNQGIIIAQDVQVPRLELVRENCARLGATCVETSRACAVVFPELSRSFDCILADVPCSNTGVMRRRADLRWRIRLEELSRLSKLQLQILQEASVQLKPGGTLVYSTCSLEPEENRGVIDLFLRETSGFELELERDLVPFRDGVDGVYVARLRRLTSP